MIEVKNLVKKYGDHLAVDHLNFQIEPGRIYGLLGPNGAGKSTTMNIMTGYLGATEGEVLINGHDILKEPEEAKKCIGYLPEIPPLYLDMKVLEYLEFAADLQGIPAEKKEAEIRKVMGMTKMMEVSERLINNLSKGYRQRVGLAQAMLGFPEILILDEPTVGLDPKQIIEIRELIRKLAKDHTVILSSHILAEIREICDYVLIISKGKLVASDTPDHLEELMAGNETVELTVKGTREKTEEILRNISYIQKSEVKKAEPDTVNVILQAETGKDIRENVFFAFAEKKTPILRMETRKVSLEDVFLELTQGETQELEDKKEGKSDESNL